MIYSLSTPANSPRRSPGPSLGDTKNLAAAMPEKVTEMKALLEKLITAGRSTSGAAQKNDVEVKRYPSETAAAPTKKAKAAK